MKRLFKFHDLPAELQSEAIAKVQRLAELTAREYGEIWTESSADLARAATFTVARNRGHITGIWSVRFASEPTVLPGTERKRPQLAA